MHIRKLFTAVEETMSEMGREANEPLKKVAVVAVSKTRWPAAAMSRTCRR